MGLLALVDQEGRPVAFIIGNYRVEVWSHMEAASMDELSQALEVANTERKADHGNNKS